MARWMWTALVLTGLVGAACTGGTTLHVVRPTAGPTTDITATPSGSTVPGGCGRTRIQPDPPPRWAASANVSGEFVMSAEGNLIGMFGPLYAGNRGEYANKILWVVREPREGAPLRLTLRPVQRAAPVITIEQPADSSPGEIYPSTVDVPTAGCWHVTAEWNDNQATLDLLYS